MEIFNATNLIYILGGFVKTVEISVLSIICSVILGTVLALIKSYAPRPFRWLVSAYIELFRCTPNLLWILFIYFTVQGIDIFISTLAFTLFTSAVMAEIVRAGLNAIPAGQFEAARSQGFGFFAPCATSSCRRRSAPSRRRCSASAHGDQGQLVPLGHQRGGVHVHHQCGHGARDRTRSGAHAIRFRVRAVFCAELWHLAAGPPVPA